MSKHHHKAGVPEARLENESSTRRVIDRLLPPGSKRRKGVTVVMAAATPVIATGCNEEEVFRSYEDVMADCIEPHIKGAGTYPPTVEVNGAGQPLASVEDNLNVDLLVKKIMKEDQPGVLFPVEFRSQEYPGAIIEGKELPSYYDPELDGGLDTRLRKNLVSIETQTTTAIAKKIIETCQLEEANADLPDDPETIDIHAGGYEYTGDDLEIDIARIAQTGIAAELAQIDQADYSDRNTQLRERLAFELNVVSIRGNTRHSWE